MPVVTRSGVRLYYEDEGAGTPLLLSHSWFCDGRQWPQAHQLATSGYRVLNLDNRGHGRSGPHTEPYTLWDTAEDLRIVLDDAGVDRAVIVGLSIGGFSAIRLALTHPERVRALGLVDTSAGTAKWTGRAKATFLGPVADTRLKPVVLEAVVTTLFGRTTRRTQRSLVETWRSRFDEQDIPSMLTALRAFMTREDLSGRLGEIDVPTLVVVGEEEVDPGVLASARLAARIRRAQLVVLPETGHLAALESPDAFTEALTGFLEHVDDRHR